MSVHKEITKHLEKHQRVIQTFKHLDEEREKYIDEVIEKCEQGLPFSVDKINEITKKMNELSAKYQLPTRKKVTTEMVKEFVLNK